MTIFKKQPSFPTPDLFKSLRRSVQNAFAQFDERSRTVLGPQPLSLAPIGRPVELVHIDANRKLMHRLHELGMTPGVELTVLQDVGGPLLLNVRHSRVALGREMAARLMVVERHS